MNKKALYESIMKNVAKEVRKVLNEDEEFDQNTNDLAEEMDVLIRILQLANINTKALDEVKQEFDIEKKKIFAKNGESSYQPSNEYKAAEESIDKMDQAVDLCKLLMLIIRKLLINTKEIDVLKAEVEKKMKDTYLALGKSAYEHQIHKKLEEVEEEDQLEKLLKMAKSKLNHLKPHVGSNALEKLEKDIDNEYKKLK